MEFILDLLSVPGRSSWTSFLLPLLLPASPESPGSPSLRVSRPLNSCLLDRLVRDQQLQGFGFVLVGLLSSCALAPLPCCPGDGQGGADPEHP